MIDIVMSLFTNRQNLYTDFMYFFSAKQLQNFIFSVVPILQWLPKYKFREHLIGDVAAGLAVGVVHLPQGIKPIL